MMAPSTIRHQGYYVSNRSVPERVDRAWAAGYEAGRAEKWYANRRLMAFAIVVAVVVWLRRRHIHLSWIVLTVLIVGTLTCAAAIVWYVLSRTIRQGHRLYLARQSRPTQVGGEEPF